MSHSVESLGPQRQKLLKQLERQIETGLRTFYRVGNALAEIRDQGLYRDDYPNFDAYCAERWDMSRSRAYQLIDAATIALTLSTTVDKLPKTEAHCRALVPLKDKPKEMAEVLETLEAEHGDDLTAETLKMAVQARVEPPPRRARSTRSKPPDTFDAGTWAVAQRAAAEPWNGEKPVDAIITEPPYGPEALQLHIDLALLASLALKPGGDLLVLTWQSGLPDVLRALCRHDLRYRWMLGTFGDPQRHDTHRVESAWRPVVWLTKGHRTGGGWVDDMAEDPAALVELFTERGDTILDPFCHNGDIGLEAVDQGRHFIGWDADPESVLIARRRLESM